MDEYELGATQNHIWSQEDCGTFFYIKKGRGGHFSFCPHPPGEGGGQIYDFFGRLRKNLIFIIKKREYKLGVRDGKKEGKEEILLYLGGKNMIFKKRGGGKI